MRRFALILGLLLLGSWLPAYGKHPSPGPLPAVTNNAVRYIVPNDKGLRAYVEAWDVQSGRKLWSKTIFRHYYIPPFGNECMHFEYLRSMVLQDGTLMLTSDRERTFSLDTGSRAVRRLKAKEPKSAAGNAGATVLLATGDHGPGVPEPDRWAKYCAI
jgi:hypothetical protein